MSRLALFVLLVVAGCSRAERQVDTDAGPSDVDANGSSGTDAPGTTDDAGADAPTSSGTCGNGSVNTGEACDDGNTASNDGCSGACALEPTQTVTVTALNQAITDDGYNGTLASMTCADVAVTAWHTPAIASMTVTVGMDHNWVGDLVIKLVSPANAVVTLASRPGYTEAADDGSGGTGSGSTLNKSYPITFDGSATTSAESMGSGVSTVCLSNNICSFAPANGAAAAGNLATLNGTSSTGTWKLCVGDAGSLDTGKIDRVTLTFGH